MYYCPHPRKIGNFRGPKNQVSPPRERQQQQPPFSIQQAPLVQILRPPVELQPQHPPPPPPLIAPTPPLPISKNRVVNVISLDAKVKVEEEERGNRLPKDKGKAKVEDVDAMPIKRARQEEIVMSETGVRRNSKETGESSSKKNSKPRRKLAIKDFTLGESSQPYNLVDDVSVQDPKITWPHLLHLASKVRRQWTKMVSTRRVKTKAMGLVSGRNLQDIIPVLEACVKGQRVSNVYVDGGAQIYVMTEQTMHRLGLKRRGHAQCQEPPSKEKERSKSPDKSMEEDVAPRRHRAQRSPTLTKRKRSPHSPPHRKSKKEGKVSKKKKERKRSPSSPSSSPFSSLDESGGYSSREYQGEDIEDQMLLGEGVLSRFSNKPHENHWHASKRVLRYIAGTLDYGITYTRGGDSTLVGFCDSDWARDIDGRRSVTGYCFSLRCGVISWISKKQPTVALSSTEAEYKAACFASCEALWLRRLLGDMGAVQEQPTMLLCDNQSCMAIARNPVFHVRTKHIEVQYHFVRELILDGEQDKRTFCPLGYISPLRTRLITRKGTDHFHLQLEALEEDIRQTEDGSEARRTSRSSLRVPHEDGIESIGRDSRMGSLRRSSQRGSFKAQPTSPPELLIPLSMEEKSEIAEMRHSKFASTDRILSYLQEKLKAKHLLIAKLQEKNDLLQTQIVDAERQLASKKDLADILHAVDFDQLTIQNQQLMSKIRDKTHEFHRIKASSNKASQALETVRKHLQNLQAEGTLVKQRLGEDISKLDHAKEEIKRSNKIKGHRL
ncbi:hypothetical protein L7F22_059339 [Adiantum nelumboides]|nr:hypothetical protein [Adiantum nelumboides]